MQTKSRSTSELYDNCTFQDWQRIICIPNYHELIKSAIELYIKYLLDIQRVDLWDYAMNECKNIEINNEQYNEIKKIFYINNVDPFEFATNIKLWMKCSLNKKNGFRITGEFDSGKSLIATSICYPFVKCHMNNHGSENEFFLSNMLNKSLILCEELFVTPATCEDMKSILGGAPIDISKKFNEKQILKRTPTFCTSNHKLFGRGFLNPIDENALAIRCFNYTFTHRFTPSCLIEWQQVYLFLDKELNK